MLPRNTEAALAPVDPGLNSVVNIRGLAQTFFGLITVIKYNGCLVQGLLNHALALLATCPIGGQDFNGTTSYRVYP